METSDRIGLVSGTGTGRIVRAHLCGSDQPGPEHVVLTSTDEIAHYGQEIVTLRLDGIEITAAETKSFNREPVIDSGTGELCAVSWCVSRLDSAFGTLFVVGWAVEHANGPGHSLLITEVIVNPQGGAEVLAGLGELSAVFGPRRLPLCFVDAQGLAEWEQIQSDAAYCADLRLRQANLQIGAAILCMAGTCWNPVTTPVCVTCGVFAAGCSASSVITQLEIRDNLYNNYDSVCRQAARRQAGQASVPISFQCPDHFGCL